MITRIAIIKGTVRVELDRENVKKNPVITNNDYETHPRRLNPKIYRNMIKIHNQEKHASYKKNYSVLRPTHENSSADGVLSIFWINEK